MWEKFVFITQLNACLERKQKKKKKAKLDQKKGLPTRKFEELKKGQL